jgi:hypothetical protein
MWCFTRYGFFSIACAQRQDGSLDPDNLMVRARSNDHLRRLQDRLPSLAAYPILATPEADYPYRIVVPKSRWATLLSDLALEQSWSNFKRGVAAFQGESGEEYSRALHDVWVRMAARIPNHRLGNGLDTVLIRRRNTGHPAPERRAREKRTDANRLPQQGCGTSRRIESVLQFGFRQRAG